MKDGYQEYIRTGQKYDKKYNLKIHLKIIQNKSRLRLRFNFQILESIYVNERVNMYQNFQF